MSESKSGTTAAIIPARWASSRFPGKPLHQLAGKPMIQHVWERCQECEHLDRAIVATDDDRIAQAARSFGAEVAMTASDHPCGTDRIAEVVKRIPELTYIINVQGDEPSISPTLIDELAKNLQEDENLPMVTAATEIRDEAIFEDPNCVKVVMDGKGNALYFSRSPVPFVRSTKYRVRRYLHKGIYGYQREFLLKFVDWPQSPLERAESLEQLRALDNGARIRIILTDDHSTGVDTPEQADKVEQDLRTLQLSAK